MEKTNSLFGKRPYFTPQKVFSGKWSITGLGKEFKLVLEQFRIWGDKYIESLKNE